MKIKSVKIIAALLTTIAFIALLNGCKKETQNSDVQSTNPTDGIVHQNNTNTAAQSRVGTVIYQASTATLDAALAAFKADIPARNLSGKPGHCPILTRTHSEVEGIYVASGAFCNNNAVVEVSYRWYVYQTVTYDGIFTPTFDLITNLGTTHHAPIFWSLYRDDENCNGQDPNVLVCPRIKQYDVTFSLTQSQYAYWETLNRLIETCSYDGSTQTLDETVSLSFPCSYYTGNPARLNVTTGSGSGHSIIVLTECSGCSTPPHVTCPTSGSFQYRLGTTGPYSAPVNIGPSGVTIPVSVSGDYQYIATLTYTCGTSQPLTNTVHVN